ncbi:MAG: FtsQ-type POTRA domain-containing protein [Alphaproteobacteria bacterium]
MDGRGRQSAALTKRRSPKARRSTEIKRFILRNKWLARAGVGLAIVLAGAGLWASDVPRRVLDVAAGVKSVAGRSAGLTVEVISIDGLVNLRAPDVRRALAISKGKGLYDVDVAAARARLLANPWVADATISRLPPDRLHVVLRERVPTVLWQHGKVFEAVDAGGGVITRVEPGEHTELFFVVGEGAAKAAPSLLEELAKAPIVAGHVRSSVYVGKRRWICISITIS